MNNNPLTIKEIAEYILFTFQSDFHQITPMKLQKLLYYVKAWSLVAEIPVFPDSFYKWEYGPVNKSIYASYKKFGKSLIPKPESFVPLPEKIKLFVDFVVENYVDLDAFTLSQLTHSELPWKQTEKNQIISEALIKSYYSKLPFAKNFPFDPNKPFFPIITSMDYAFILDFNTKDFDLKNGYLHYQSYYEYKKQKNRIIKKFKVTFG